MKKSTLFFLSTLITVLLSASTSYAYSTSQSACEANCTLEKCAKYTTRCNDPVIYICTKGSYTSSNGVFTSSPFTTITDCNRALLYDQLSGYRIIKSCYNDGSYYRYQHSTNQGTPDCALTECPSNCSSCDSSSVCTTCNSGYYLSSGGSCMSCPSNATCDGSSTFTCNSGYKKSGNSCVKDKTVSSCPSRMKLSSDGCCCINK